MHFSLFTLIVSSIASAAPGIHRLVGRNEEAFVNLDDIPQLDAQHAIITDPTSEFISRMHYRKVSMDLPDGTTKYALDVIPLQLPAPASSDRRANFKRPNRPVQNQEMYRLLYRKSAVSNVKPESRYQIVGIVPDMTPKMTDFSHDEQEFMFWEASQHPSADLIFDIVSADRQIAEKVMTSNNGEILKFLPDVISKSADKDPQLFEFILNHPNLVDWRMEAEKIKPGSALKLTQFVDILESLITRGVLNSGKSLDALAHSVTGSGWGKIVTILVSKKHNAAALEILKTQSIADSIHTEAFKEIIRNAFQHETLDSDLIKALSSSFVAPRVDEQDWSRIVSSLVSQRQEDLLAIVLGQPEVVSRLTDDSVRKTLTILSQSPLYNRDLLSTLRSKPFVSRITSDQWASVISSWMIKGWDASAVAMLKDSEFISTISDSGFKIIFESFVETAAPSSELISTFREPHLISHVSSDQWTKLVTKLIGIHRGSEGLSLLKEEATLKSLSDEQMTTIVKALTADTLRPDHITILSQEPIVSRVTGVQWGSLLNEMLASENTMAALSMMRHESIMKRFVYPFKISPSRIPDKEFHVVVQEILNHGTNNPDIVKSLLQSVVGSRLLSTEWSSLLSDLVSKKLYETFKIVFKSEVALKAISDQDFKKIVSDVLTQGFMNYEVLQLLMQDQMVERISGKDWAQILKNVIAKHEDGTATTILVNKKLVSRLPSEAVPEIVNALAEHSTARFELIASFVDSSLASQVKAEEWEKLVLSFVGTTRDVNAAYLLKMPNIASQLSDQAMAQLIKLSFERSPGYGPSNEFVAVISQSSIASRISGNDWGQLLLFLVSKNRDTLSWPLLRNAELMNRVPDNLFSGLVDKLLTTESFLNLDLTKTLKMDHIQSRVSSTQFEDFISKLHERRRDDVVSLLMESPEIAQRVHRIPDTQSPIEIIRPDGHTVRYPTTSHARQPLPPPRAIRPPANRAPGRVPLVSRPFIPRLPRPAGLRSILHGI